jgi:asparagine N-glycosylation enzyme membrane subunit Stt3
MPDNKKAAKSKSDSSAQKEDEFFSKSTIVAALAVVIGVGILITSYRIRMMAINEFGPVIHEFDPYFNLRATEVSC